MAMKKSASYFSLFSVRALCALLLLSLPTGCAYLPDWLGGDDGPKAKGERIALLAREKTVTADPEAASLPFTMPTEKARTAVPQTTVGYEGRPDHYALARGIKKVYSIDLDSDNSGDLSYLPPVIAGDKLYVLDAKGVLQCRSGERYRKTLWKKKLPGAKGMFRYGGMILRRGVIYISGGGVYAFALKAADGENIWQKRLSAPVRGTPALAGDLAIFGSLTGKTFALKAADGDTVWTHEGAESALAYTGAASPAVFGDTVFVPYPSGDIYALSAASGAERWNRTGRDRYLRTRSTIALKDTGVTPQIYRGYVFLATNAGHLSVNDIRTGTPVWQKDITVIREPWPASDYLFFLTGKDVLAAINVPAGDIRWTLPLPRYKNEEKRSGPIRYTAPILAGGRVYILSDRGVMYAVAPDTGKIAEEYDIPKDVRNAPLIAGGKMYVTAPDGETAVFE